MQKEHFFSAVFKVPSKDETEAKKPRGNGKPPLLVTTPQTSLCPTKHRLVLGLQE